MLSCSMCSVARSVESDASLRRLRCEIESVCQRTAAAEACGAVESLVQRWSFAAGEARRLCQLVCSSSWTEVQLPPDSSLFADHSAMDEGEDPTHQRVRFVTQIQAIRVTSDPFTVPARLGRKGLTDVSSLLPRSLRSPKHERAPPCGTLTTSQL